jgi:hypothetical protein
VADAQRRTLRVSPSSFSFPLSAAAFRAHSRFHTAICIGVYCCSYCHKYMNGIFACSYAYVAQS